MSCNAGEYSTAEDTLSAETKILVHEDMVGAFSGVKGFCDAESRQGTIVGIDFKSEKIRGEGANVTAGIRFKDRSTKSNEKALIIENGEWKMMLGTMGNGGN